MKYDNHQRKEHLILRASDVLESQFCDGFIGYNCFCLPQLLPENDLEMVRRLDLHWEGEMVLLSFVTAANPFVVEEVSVRENPDRTLSSLFSSYAARKISCRGNKFSAVFIFQTHEQNGFVFLRYQFMWFSRFVNVSSFSGRTAFERFFVAVALGIVYQSPVQPNERLIERSRLRWEDLALGQ